MRARATLVFGGGLAALLVVLVGSLTQGYEMYSLRLTYEALFQPQDVLEHHILLGMRLPRAVMAVLAGAALAVAGVLLQTVTRNPLASAGTFGINAGAYLVIVLAAVLFPALKSSLPFLLAFAGGAGAAVMVFLLAGGRRSTPIRMALAGMIVTMVLGSFTSSLQLLYENETNGLFIWGSGSLVQNDWTGVQLSWPWIVVTLAAAFLAARKLDMLELNEETAASLGQRVNLVKFLAVAAAVLLAAVTVSVVGPIGFIGLIAPHMIRLLGLRRHRVLLPASALWGAVVLLLADGFARLFQSVVGMLPAGVVTAIIGAPWLIWLAVRKQREAAGGGGGSSEAGGGSTMAVGVTRRRLSFPLVLSVTSGLLLMLCLLSLSVGAVRVPVLEVLQIILGQADGPHVFTVLELRAPRILVALLAGAALAAAGALLQGAVRNPLADPSIVGVTSGAGVGALLLIVLLPVSAMPLLPLAAVAGGLLSAALVYALALRSGFHPRVLILVGIGVTSFHAAVIHFLVIKSGMGAAPALAWLAGSTYARSWGEVWLLAPVLLAVLPAAFVLGRRVDLLAFGDQTSLGLGLKLAQTRLLTAGAGVALAAAAVAAVGTIGFVGLLAPHAARIVAGQHFQRVLALSLLLGGLLVVVADLVGRTALAPKEIPAGLVTALIGTPYLLFLMFRSRR